MFSGLLLDLVYGRAAARRPAEKERAAREDKHIITINVIWLADTNSCDPLCTITMIVMTGRSGGAPTSGDSEDGATWKAIKIGFMRRAILKLLMTLHMRAPRSVCDWESASAERRKMAHDGDSSDLIIHVNPADSAECGLRSSFPQRGLASAPSCSPSPAAERLACSNKYLSHETNILIDNLIAHKTEFIHLRLGCSPSIPPAEAGRNRKLRKERRKARERETRSRIIDARARTTT